jgi:hypothetical protein
MFILLAAVYVASIDIRATRGASITGDEPFYLLTTQSLLQDGDLDLTQQYARRSYESFFDHADGLWRQSVSRKNGVLLSPHNPGLSFLVLPGFAAAGLVGAQVQLLTLAALTFALTYILVARITGAPGGSWLATAVVGLSASAFIYSTEVYPEMPAALMLVVSVWLVHEQTLSGYWRALLLAAALTAMVWLGVKYAPLALLVAFWSWRRMDARGRWALLGAGSASAVLFGWSHWHTFGALTPYSVGAVYAGDSTFSVLGQHLEFADRAYRLLGLFIDRSFGIGRWAPVLLLAVPALVLLWKQGGSARWILALIATQLLIAAFVAITMMGWWFPGRTLVAVLPLLALPLTLLLLRFPWWGKLAWGLLAAGTLALTLDLALAGHAGEVTIAVNPFEMKSWLFQATAPFFPDYTYWNAETWRLTGGWLAAAVASAIALTLTHQARGILPAAPASATTRRGTLWTRGGNLGQEYGSWSLLLGWTGETGKRRRTSGVHAWPSRTTALGRLEL